MKSSTKFQPTIQCRKWWIIKRQIPCYHRVSEAKYPLIMPLLTKFTRKSCWTIRTQSSHFNLAIFMALSIESSLWMKSCFASRDMIDRSERWIIKRWILCYHGISEASSPFIMPVIDSIHSQVSVEVIGQSIIRVSPPYVCRYSLNYRLKTINNKQSIEGSYGGWKATTRSSRSLQEKRCNNETKALVDVKVTNVKVELQMMLSWKRSEVLGSLETWHSYIPASSGRTLRMCSVHVSDAMTWSDLNRPSAMKVSRSTVTKSPSSSSFLRIHETCNEHVTDSVDACQQPLAW